MLNGVTYESTVMAIARGLVAGDPVVRARSADAVTDVVRGLEADDAALLAYLLISVRIAETDHIAREAQLHGLAEVAEWHGLPAAVLTLIGNVPQDTVAGSEIEYMEYLLQRRSDQA